MKTLQCQKCGARLFANPAKQRVTKTSDGTLVTDVFECRACDLGYEDSTLMQKQTGGVHINARDISGNMNVFMRDGHINGDQILGRSVSTRNDKPRNRGQYGMIAKMLDCNRCHHDLIVDVREADDTVWMKGADGDWFKVADIDWNRACTKFQFCCPHCGEQTLNSVDNPPNDDYVGGDCVKGDVYKVGDIDDKSSVTIGHNTSVTVEETIIDADGTRRTIRSTTRNE